MQGYQQDFTCQVFTDHDRDKPSLRSAFISPHTAGQDLGKTDVDEYCFLSQLVIVDLSTFFFFLASLSLGPVFFLPIKARKSWHQALYV